MSWMSGTDLAEELWATLTTLNAGRGEPDPIILKMVAHKWVDIFAERGCNDLEGVGGPLGDAANRQRLANMGASIYPTVGSSFNDEDGYAWTFDGNRWNL